MGNLGFLTALGAALAWGTYMVPFKKSKSENLIQFQALIAVGILISGLVISLILGFPLIFNLYGVVAGILAGIVWGSQIVPLKLGNVLPSFNRSLSTSFRSNYFEPSIRSQTYV